MEIADIGGECAVRTTGSRIEVRSVDGDVNVKTSGGEIRVEDVAQLAEEVLDGVKHLVALFDNPETPYAATRRAGFSYDYDDYAHLARVLEWSQAMPDNDGTEGGAA